MEQPKEEKDERERGERSDRVGRSDSRERGWNRDRDRDRDRERDRDRSRRDRRDRRSPERRSSRDRREDRPRRVSRSRSRSNERHRKRASRSRSRSPVARPVRHYEPKKPAAPQATNRFWDGFQWVDKVNPATGLVESGPGTTEPIPGVSGLPKDRRIYVGNLPDSTDPEHLKQFMNQTLTLCGAVPVGVKTAVLSLWMSSDNKYGFFEMCSADVATVTMGLNGIAYGGSSLKIARPKTYALPTTGGMMMPP